MRETEMEDTTTLLTNTIQQVLLARHGLDHSFGLFGRKCPGNNP